MKYIFVKLLLVETEQLLFYLWNSCLADEVTVQEFHVNFNITYYAYVTLRASLR